MKDEVAERGDRRAVRVIETKCFGLCPKKAVVALNASAPDRLLTISRGTRSSDALSELIAPPD